jgi:hypothetical protein
MDVLYFLKQRTAFIRQFYEVAAGPYLERKRKIEDGEEPYEQPYYDEYSNGEPAYLEEWTEADESLHALAYSCVSMLAAALHLYFVTWEQQLGIPAGDAFKANFKKGWLAGYEAYLAHHIGVNFDNCPTNMELLKEVVIARNRVQHPESSVEHFGSITNIKPRYSVADLQKLSRPVFLDEDERKMLAEVDEAVSSWFMPPTLHVTREKLIAAIDEADKFCDWLEGQITNVYYRR